MAVYRRENYRAAPQIAAIDKKVSEIVAAFYTQRERPAHLDKAEYRRMLSSESYL
jgi:hypothetical protein